MRLFGATIFAAAALALAACGQSGAEKAADAPAAEQQAAVNNCPATAEAVWVQANGGDYKVEAATTGATCADATATLTIRGPENQQLHTFSAPARAILPLMNAADQAAMQAALTTWITQTSSAMRTTAGLPNWVAASLQPEIGATRFYPEQELTRDAYLAIRTAALPQMCYAQGREQWACVVLENGAVRKIGLNTLTN
jgi:hypothetical protein